MGVWRIMGQTIRLRQDVYGEVEFSPDDGDKWYVSLFTKEGKDITTTGLCDSKPEAIEVAKVLARKYKKGRI